MQVLFFLPNIQEKILNHNPNDKFAPNMGEIDDAKMDDNDKVKLKASRQLVEKMQKLFA